MVKTLVVEVDEDEMACCIMEACLEMKRPKGHTGTQALNCLPEHLKKEAVWFRSAARAAILYFGECLEKTQRVN